VIFASHPLGPAVSEASPRLGLALTVPALATSADDASAQAAVEREGIAVRAAATASRDQAAVQLQWPAPGIITSPFGERRGNSFHPGLDIDGRTGDPVVAAGPGTVLMAGPAPVGYDGYGIVVMINHGGGIATLYAHLSSVAVTPGQQVAAGALIGAIGATGIATGSHLHFEVRQAGRPVDPILWLPPRPPHPALQPAPQSAVVVDQPRLQPPHTA